MQNKDNCSQNAIQGRREFIRKSALGATSVGLVASSTTTPAAADEHEIVESTEKLKGTIGNCGPSYIPVDDHYFIGGTARLGEGATSASRATILGSVAGAIGGLGGSTFSFIASLVGGALGAYGSTVVMEENDFIVLGLRDEHKSFSTWYFSAKIPQIEAVILYFPNFEGWPSPADLSDAEVIDTANVTETAIQRIDDLLLSVPIDLPDPPAHLEPVADSY